MGFFRSLLGLNDDPDTCVYCNGSGKDEGIKCSHCYGTGSDEGGLSDDRDYEGNRKRWSEVEQEYIDKAKYF